MRGGRGADAWPTGGSAHGPGGGGGGGVVVRSLGLSVDVSGGSTGITTTSDNPSGGATHGAEDGASGLDIVIGTVSDAPGQNAGWACATVDWGDAPDDGSSPASGSYTTLAASGGPNHFVRPNLRLGAVGPDDDAGDQQSTNADADDGDGNDDEDGLTRGGADLSGQILTPGNTETISVSMTGAGFLNLFIDLNDDGDFADTVDGQAEHFVADDDQTGTTGTRSVDYTVDLPSSASGTTIVRARWCATANECDAPTGVADSGEVEDYRVVLFSAPAGGLCYGSFIDGASSPSDSAIWSFDDTLLDGSGNFHGPQNSPTVTDDAHDALGSGSAVALSSGGIQYSDGSFLNDAFTDASYGFWIRPDAFSPASDQQLFDEGGTTNGVSVVLTTAGTVRFDVAESSVIATIADVPLPDDGDWHHVALTYDAGIVSAYVDGRLRGQSDTGFGALSPHASDGGFGENFGGSASASSTSDYVGAFDEAFVQFGAVLPGSALRGYVECVGPVDEDFGDAPDTGVGSSAGNYETLLASNGPSHLFNAGDPFIGTQSPDSDTGAVQGSLADGDATNGSDDEDGIAVGGIDIAGQTLTLGGDVDLEITVAGGGFLNLWLDLNNDGDFADTIDGVAEQFLADDDLSANFGSNTIVRTVSLPRAATIGSSILRARYCAIASDCASPTGLAGSGEIEDHAVVLGTPADLSVALVPTTATPTIGFPFDVTATVTNEGTLDTTGVVATIEVPAGYGYVSDDGGGSFDPATGLWTVGALATATDATLTLVPRVSGPYELRHRITAADQPDVDSEPAVGFEADDLDDAVADDDEASTTPVPATGVGVSPGPQSCSAGTSLFDWDVEPWADGDRSGSFTIDGVGVNLTVFDPATALDGTPFGAMPTRAAVYQGGLGSIENALRFEADAIALSADSVVVRIDFAAPVDGVRLALFDIDANDSGNRLERLVVSGTNDGAPVIGSVDGGSATSLSGSTVIGVSNSAVTGANSGDGTVSIGFDAPVTRIEVLWGEAPGTDLTTDPGQPAFALHDFSFCTPERDYSDAPTSTTSYGEVAHALGSGLTLGAAVTADAGGFDSPNADGDSDDGIIIPTLTSSVTTRFSMTVSDPTAFLQGWVDWNGDGDFADANERIALNLQDDGSGVDATAADGVIDFDVAVPGSAVPSTFARFRLSSVAGIASDLAFAVDGEVEDYRIDVGGLDFGDAPDAGLGTGVGDYETLLSGNGPRHGIVPGLRIGATAPDADPGVFRNASADADDVNGVADEGDLVFPTLLAVAPTYTLDVTVTNTLASQATLFGWIDFDQSGTFDEDESATAIVSTPQSDQVVQLLFTVPLDVTSGATYARFRLTTDALAASGGGVDERSLGPATDGEVEDYTFDILDTTFDFGDAPDVYDTLLASNGARHGVDPDLRLGLATDSEPDGVPGILAEGDDGAATADEDGVRTFPALSSSNTTYVVDVRVRNTTGQIATLVSWIDFDLSETFDADEAVLTPVPNGTVGTIQVRWPNIGAGGPDIVAGRTYGRLRITTDAIDATTPAGAFADGEVEDYDLVIFSTEQCDIGPANTVPISPLDFSSPTLIAGTAATVGARYRYDDVTPGVDALVEISDIVNVSLIDPDFTGIGFVDAFQPWYNLAVQPGEGYSEYVITLVKADTTQPVEPAPAFLASTIDNDDLREFVEYYKPFGTVFRETPTRLSIEDRGTFFRFEALTSDGVTSTDPSATQNIATLRYEATAEFIYRAGSINADGGSGTRIAVLRFDCIEFNNPQITTVDVDFGDAPAQYPTLLNDFGALHTVVGGIGLGFDIDAEVEGAPSLEADGDDLDTRDDEDAVTINGLLPADARLVPGANASFEIATTGTSLLSAWVDWNGNGTWADPGERIANELASTGGVETIVVPVPGNAAAGTTYARFRYTTDTGIGFDGGATDGEVEDHVVVIARSDYGDIPDAGPGTSRDDYTTLQTTGGPSHEVSSTPTVFLGLLPPDGDNGLATSLAADADDGNGVDDEDGVLLLGSPINDRTFFRNRDYDIDVVVNGGGFLNVWLDLNRDGDFDDTIGGIGEQVLNDSDFSANTGATPVVVTLSIPGPAVVGNSYLRVRYCSTANTCDTPGGSASDGEVEDYRVELAPLTNDGVVRGVVFEDNGAVGGIAHDGFVNGDEAGLGGVDVLLLFDADGDDACDGTEDVLAQATTDGDGLFELRPAIADENKPACLVAAAPVGYRSISENDGGNAGVILGGPFDDFATLLTPGPGDIVDGVNFGDIRLPRLSPDRQDVIRPGGSASYAHVYLATTDATVDFSLGTANEAPTGFAWSDVLYRDLDCDENVSPADAAEPITGVPVLADEQVCLVVRTFVPADAPADALYARVVDAVSAFTGTSESATAAVTDITTVIAGQLRLFKSVRNIGPDGLADTGDDGDLAPETFNTASPGDVLRYRLRFRNEDALPVRALQLSDATPAFTELNVPIACPTPLANALSACAETTSSGANAAGYRGEVRWNFTGLLEPGAEGIVEFDVRIDQ